MNIITRIALSLSLIALIAQPVQAASYADYAKKAGKIALYAGMTCAGMGTFLFIIPYAKGHHEFYSEEIEKLNGQMSACKDNIYAQKVCTCNIDFYTAQRNKMMAINLADIAIGCAFVYGGIYGLKKEICPNFNPIAWIKNKLGKNKQHIEQSA